MKKTFKNALIFGTLTISAILVILLVSYFVFKQNQVAQSVSISNAKCCYYNAGDFQRIDYTGTCSSYPKNKPAMEFTNNICVNSTTSAYACQGHGYKCDSFYVSSDPSNYALFYCDLQSSASFVKCDNGCDVSTGLCNGGVQDCTNGYMACCNDANDCKSNIYRSDGDVFKCVSGKWTLWETCSERCSEQSSTYAYCNTKWYYCFDSSTAICFKKSTKTAGCYDTEAECKSHKNYCCFSRKPYWSAVNDGNHCKFQNGINNYYPACGSLTGYCCITISNIHISSSPCNSNEEQIFMVDGTLAMCNEYIEDIDKENCTLSKCEDCGTGLSNLCDKEECESCINLGCKFTPSLIGGTCKSEFKPCESCWAFFMGKNSDDKTCIESVFWSSSSWIGSLLGLEIRQGIGCPVYYIGVSILIIIGVLIISLIAILIVKSSRRKK